MRVMLQFIATTISVFAILGGVACKKLVPEYWTDWLLASIVLFWTIEMVMSFLLAKFKPHINTPTLEGKRFMKIYMIAKGIKLLVVLVFIVVGLSAMNSMESKASAVFAVSAVALYLLHLAGETYVVTRKK